MEQGSADLLLKVVLAVNAVGTSIVGILVFTWTRNANRAVADALLARRIEDLEARFDKAGQRSSDLTDKIQVLAPRSELLALEVDLKKEHRFRSDQIQAISVDMGKLQTQVAKLEARVDGQDRILARLSMN